MKLLFNSSIGWKKGEDYFIKYTALTSSTEKNYPDKMHLYDKNQKDISNETFSEYQEKGMAFQYKIGMIILYLS